MKLTVGDIRFSESGYASATVGVGTGTFPFLLFSICKMDVSVPVVDGKEIKDYDVDLRNKAREVITKIYKEIVCGENDVGEQSTMLIQAANSNSIQMMQASIDELKEQITRLREEKHPKKEAIKPFGIKDGEIVMSAQRIALITPSPKDCLEERVALLEKRLSGKKTVHVSEKVVELYNHDGTLAVRMGDLNQTERRLGGERSMRITSEHGQLLVHGERVSAPTYDHRNVIINKAIDELKSGHINMLKRLGRCMGLLQVAAEIEAVNQLCGSACRENVLKDFDNPPFKNVPDDWISPGVKYLKRRLNKEAREDNELRRIYGIAKIAAKDIISPAKGNF